MSEIKVHKKKGTVEQGLIVQNIVVRPVVRRSQDIDSWRQALRSAEAINPIRVPLYDLYADILLDGTLTSLIGKRINGVTKTKLTFLDAAGKEVPAVKALIGKKQFRTLRKELALAKIWGITVCELTIKNGNFHVYSVPRKHIKPNVGRIVWEQYGVDGFDYREAPYDRYVIEVGEPDDLGLLLKAAQYVIYKRGGFGDWAHYAEIFGMPFREAKYDGYNPTVRAQIEQALEEAGSAAYIIMPKDAELKVHENRGTAGSTDLYNQLRKACNEELCILILGQTETTTSSSSSGYAQSKTHADVEDSINADDREDELAYFNEQVLPILANLGYPVTGGTFAHQLAEEKLTKKEKAEIVLKMKNEAKLPIGDDYLYEEFSIPKPDDYNEQKKKQEDNAQPVPSPAPFPPDDIPADKKVKKVKKKEEKADKKLLTRWDKFRLMLMDFFDPAP